MTPDTIQQLQAVSPQQVDNLVGQVFADLDKLRADLNAVNPSRPDPDILVQNGQPFQYFEFIALASYRLRGRWKRASAAAKALEKRRTEWNIVIGAALLRARHELAGLDEGTPEYKAQVERMSTLIDRLSTTFRPFAGPNAQWVAVTAASIGTGVQ